MWEFKTTIYKGEKAETRREIRREKESKKEECRKKEEYQHSRVVIIAPIIKLRKST